jgi:putative transcriptional regulator
MERLKGRLLVASPQLGDENFDRSVVLVLEHSDDGALGLVLNRASGLEVVDPLPEWHRFTSHPEVVFIGGPVSRNSVIALARVDAELPSGAWEQVLGSVGVLDLTRDPDAIGAAVGDLRVFAGYAGWGPGQLEDEIGAEAWYVVAGEPADAFTQQPERLWRDVLARQPGDLARVALVPADPRLN